MRIGGLLRDGGCVEVLRFRGWILEDGFFFFFRCGCGSRGVLREERKGMERNGLESNVGLGIWGLMRFGGDGESKEGEEGRRKSRRRYI